MRPMGHSHLRRCSLAAPALILAIGLVLPATAAGATDLELVDANGLVNGP
jgi:hypothetical protein